MSDGIIVEHLAASVQLPTGRSLDILRDVSIVIPRESSAAILGRSGSGKTTLLTLLGLMGTPTSGKIIVDGRDMTGVSDAEAAKIRNTKIGFVFQSFSLISHLNVIENIEMPCKYGHVLSARQARRDAMESLDCVGMSAFSKRRVSELSGGEQQRVAIARALVRHPDIILADEPTGALDIDTGSEIMSLLAEKARSARACLVVVTHDQAVADQLDTKWELSSGRIARI